MIGLGSYLTQFFRLLARDARGNALAIFAGALFPMLAMIGGGVDMSVGYMAQAKLQTACDAGVLAARQNMTGNTFTNADEAQGQKFFTFNFPDGIYGVDDAALEITKDPDDNAQLNGFASANVPTSIMRVFGFNMMPITAACDARRDMGYNDVAMVLDVTGSMDSSPSSGGQKKIVRLRDAAESLYESMAAADAADAARFAMISYSQTVNVAGLLTNRDILRDQQYVKKDRVCFIFVCWDEFSTKTVNVKYSTWGDGSNAENSITAFRTSNSGCIEERPSAGNSMSPFVINDTVTAADVNNRAANNSDENKQFGRYDPGVQEGNFSSSCPSTSSNLTSYANKGLFRAAINHVTQRVGGNTYYDVGMLWGLRLLSRNGMFAANNPATKNGVVVNQHIIFMTDGALVVNQSSYSAHGIEQYQNRTRGSGSDYDAHMKRFNDVCTLAKSMGITVWVIAFDTTNESDIKPCATSAETYYYSNGSDLEEVFADIGAGIGRLRLTK